MNNNNNRTQINFKSIWYENAALNFCEHVWKVSSLPLKLLLQQMAEQNWYFLFLYQLIFYHCIPYQLTRSWLKPKFTTPQ